MIMIMINNLNHNPSSTTAKGSFHGTGISFFQFPSKSNVGHFQDGMDMPSPETKKNHWLPDNFTTVPAVALKKANVAVPQTPNQITAFEGHLSRALMKERCWIEHSLKLIKKRIDKGDIVASTRYVR
ncbi:hypothetical protein NHX12_006892 [Muraenolepis orangiensis]|uniref:Uncharacterized protein n=1 Tax=Muraenolepis orangiensis TaxID=630683 RepID=A0A9Q0IB23_9TELE|nr:hypothetical protein NHX12_006892 [Muraenolepis orangiensis]